VIGLSLQSALFQAILRSKLDQRLKGEIDAGEIARKVRESLEYIRKLPPQQQSIVRGVYELSMRAVIELVMALEVGPVISSFFIREKSLCR